MVHWSHCRCVTSKVTSQRSDDDGLVARVGRIKRKLETKSEGEKARKREEDGRGLGFWKLKLGIKVPLKRKKDWNNFFLNTETTSFS
ncbi:hypothetical protein RIF29_37775 [Crotalaria pallida]|uniref:Uncharacterized protein n=1 Tax=Crotalaria pallida TaxID=3830 RepID=A0AAN9E102_CROPI